MTGGTRLKWDKWQREAIDYEGSITIRCGRQVGKSTCVGKRSANLMLKYSESVSLMIAPAQRQSSELFIKTIGWLEVEHQKQLEKHGGFKALPEFSTKRNMELKRIFESDFGIYNELPTKTTIILKKDFDKPRSRANQGSICYSLPAGKTGVYLRCYALDFLAADEAAYIPEPVYTALKPMLAVSAKTRGLGWETFLSTPFGKGGFFYKSHFSKDYKQFHVSSEDCSRIGKDFLRKEKLRLTKTQYRQEYLGEFCDEWNQFFSTNLIKASMTFIEWGLDNENRNGKYYLGVDIAGYGGDENAFVISKMCDNRVKVVKCFTTERVSTTDTIGRIIAYNTEFNFRKIFVDDGGLGGSVTDILQEKLGRKVVGLNNSSKRIQVEGEEKKRGILKEDLYSNALWLMENNKVDVINNLQLMRSLKSVTFEYSSNKNLKIFGDYTHLSEAFVRALWCWKIKGMRLYMV